jgi:hypothetical protein
VLATFGCDQRRAGHHWPADRGGEFSRGGDHLGVGPLGTAGGVLDAYPQLESGADEAWEYQRDYDTVWALRAKMPKGGDEVALIAAMALVYGWAVFGDQLIDAFGVDPARRREVDFPAR